MSERASGEEDEELMWVAHFENLFSVNRVRGGTLRNPSRTILAVETENVG
jgi:hypothetical protein